MTRHIGTIIVPDGYNGHTVAIYLCKDSSGAVYAVHSSGYFMQVEGFPPQSYREA